MIIQLRYRNYYQCANGVALIDIISVIWIELRLLCKALHLYAGLFDCIGNKNKPPAMQVRSQKALASRKNLHVIMSLRFANQIQYNKEVSEWITTVYHTQNGHANII